MRITDSQRIDRIELQLKALITLVKMNGYNEPKLKQLDQSVFDNQARHLGWAAIEEDGSVYLFAKKPFIDLHKWAAGIDEIEVYIGKGYNASDWQNSLIERDKVKLTGSDLARAMLVKFKKPIMCRVSKNYIGGESYGFDLIKSFRTDGEKYLFHGKREGEWVVVIPINNQGEPLTAAQVGL